MKHSVLFSAAMLATATLLGGCVTGPAAWERLTDRNREGLHSLREGMSRGEVLATMESRTYFIREGPQLRRLAVANPFRVSDMPLENGGSAEILYYYTRVVGYDCEVAPDELTPVVLEDDRLVGWGWPFLEKRWGATVTPDALADEIEREILAERARESEYTDSSVLHEEAREAVGRASHLMRAFTVPNAGIGPAIGGF